MAISWRRRHIRRLLGGLLIPGEDIVMVERLGLGGWWLTTDRALYVVHKPDDPKRVPFGQIRSVEWAPGRMTATVRTTTGDVLNVAIRARSRILKRIEQIGPPTSGATA